MDNLKRATPEPDPVERVVMNLLRAYPDSAFNFKVCEPYASAAERLHKRGEIAIRHHMDGHTPCVFAGLTEAGIDAKAQEDYPR